MRGRGQGRRRATRLAAAAAIGTLLAGFGAAASAAPAMACGDATVVHGSFGFVWGMGSPEPSPTDVIFEATALGGDGSWSASVRAHALIDPYEGGFELGCLDSGTMYEFWFDVNVGGGQSYLYHVGTNYPNGFQGEVEQFPENPGWFTLDTRYPPVVVGAEPPTAPTDVIRVPAGSATTPLVIAPANGLDRPVQLPTTAPGVATLPDRDVVLAANGAQLTLFPGTVATGPSGWDGRVVLPTAVVPEGLPAGAGGVVGVMVGTGSGGLSFSRPARIVLLGQAGKSAGFVPEGGAFAPIEAVCASNDEAGLGAAGECAIDDGADLVIWTTHFTTFVAYAPGTQLAATGDSGVPLALLALCLLGAGAAGVAFASIGRDGRLP